MARIGRILAILCFFIVGCQNSSTNQSPVSVAKDVEATASNNGTLTSEIIETMTPAFSASGENATVTLLSPEGTITLIPSPSITPTPDATNQTLSTPTALSQDYLVCETYKSFDLNDYPDLEAVYNVQFFDEDKIRVRMFLRGLDVSSPFIYEYSEGILDIETEEFSLDFQEPFDLLLNPCEGDCTYDVLDQSPDGKWQIVRLFDEGAEFNGFWLVNAEEKVQLVDYLPWNFRWEWSNYSSLLWFYYSLPEFGVVDVVVQLTSPPEIVGLEPNELNPLTTIYYDIALSPGSLTVLSTARNSRNVPMEIRESDELFVFDFRQNMIEPISSTTISGLDGVEWNEATNSFLLYFDLDRRTEIKEWEGSGVWSISDLNMPDRDLDGRAITVSPSGERIAAYYRNQILVFGCE